MENPFNMPSLTPDDLPNMQGVEVPEEVKFIVSEDGRIFADMNDWTLTIHSGVHLTAPILDMLYGETYANGMHDMAMAMHQQVNSYREVFGLLPLHTPDATEAPSDTAEAEAEIASLSEAFSLPAFGDDDAR
jgi:hypothetical protein